MSARNIITLFALVLCLGTVSAVVLQRQQLSALRAQQAARSVQTEAPTLPPTAAPSPDSANDEASTEIVRLRGEVTRLTARKRELAGVAQENERLRAQLTTNQTNVAEKRLPQGYIRKSEAQRMGYSTPENTLQSFLWALHHQDIEAFLQCLTPAQAERLRAQIQSSPDGATSFFKGSEVMPGAGIVNRQVQPDGSLELQITVGPGVPTQTLRAQSINGEWKFDEAGL